VIDGRIAQALLRRPNLIPTSIRRVCRARTFNRLCSKGLAAWMQPFGDSSDISYIRASEVVPVRMYPNYQTEFSRVRQARSRLVGGTLLSRFPMAVGSVYDARHQMHKRGEPLPRPYGMPTKIWTPLPETDERVYA